ncbi:hypothetical protein Bca52824_033121 [Brassica carinata]|uniref:Uncharacterized protein n=1 Tax=Brassica carinata TaxID=52824 RepID=A0A8X7V5S5_BRACI|nr:hypothetical protein Bca52824_033121 [Brassica carinata]
MTTSGPAAMAPSSAPPVSPGVVPPELYLTHLPLLKCSVCSCPLCQEKRRCSATCAIQTVMSMLLSEQHGKENYGGRGQAGQWWHAFIQHYNWDDKFHDEIYLKWKKQTQVTVCGRISPNMRDNRHPAYINDNHNITAIVQKYSTAEAKRKIQSAAASRTSAPTGKKMHKHGAGPRCLVNIEYKMVLDERPPYTALARKTHMGKDGSFLDKRAEKLTKKGTIYGLGSVQYKNTSPPMPIPVSLQHNLDVEMRMTGFETTISEVKEDISALKTQLTEGIVKLSHNLKVSPKLQFNLKISHKLKLSLRLNPNIS